MADVDVSLIVTAVVIPFLLIFFNLLVMAHYIDPQAAGGHFIGKLMVLLGMLMAECTVLLLPLDIGNRSGVVGCGSFNSCGGLNLSLVWQIAYCIIAGLVVVIMPFFMFYYENDDEGMEATEKSEGSCFTACLIRFQSFKRSFFSALCYTLASLTFGVIGFFIMHRYIGYTLIPYRLTSVSVGSVGVWMTVDPVVAADAGVPLLTAFRESTNPTEAVSLCRVPGVLCPCGATGGCRGSSQQLRMDVSYVIYLAALMSFLGWWLFSLYVGIGFIALPMDCINAFIHRPKLLSLSEARTQRKALMKRAEELLKLGEELGGRMVDAMDGARNKSERKKAGKVGKPELIRFKVLVDMLEKDLEEFQLGDPENYRQHYNPLVPYAKLVFGVVSIVITLAWLIHIIVYMLFQPPLHPFINEYLSFFDSFFPLFGTITIALMSMYLLLAASKGAAKFGTRFFLIAVHELEPHKTLLNSFMFNVQLVLLCVLPTVQFTTDAFSGYARYTDAEVIFGSQFKYMEGFRYCFIYNVFYFMILGMFILSAIYFAIFPSDRRHLNQVMAQIKAGKAKQAKDLERKINQQGGSLAAVV